MIRLFDILFASIGLLLLSPVFLAVSIWIKVDDAGPIFYLQQRIGKMGKPFGMYKFRTMRPNADKLGLLTVGLRDARITNCGIILRKYKLDELPQLWNVLIGDMSVVGPRPEVKKYVDLYSENQKKVLQVRPGITDFASIAYASENELLSQSQNPEQTYIQEIMPAKIQLNMKFILEPSLYNYFKIIGLTLIRIIK